MYTTPSVSDANASSWGTGDNAKFTLDLAGGKIDLWGHNGNDCLYVTSGTGVESTINISGGELAVSGGDMVIGSNDSEGTTTINISNGGVLSCGTDATERWLKFGVGGSGSETINVNAGGTLAFWFITHTSTGSAELNINGGTLKFIGTTTFYNGSIDPYYAGNTDGGTDSFTVSIGENGGTFDTGTNTNISINKVISGTGSLTKKGAGTLTFTVEPTFMGSITVEEGAGPVILPAGATIDAGTGTGKRTLANGTVEYFHGSVSSSSTLFTAGTDATITLAGDYYLDIDADIEIGKLTVNGSGTLYLSGSVVATATSLDIASGTTVQLASGTTLATGALQASTVTGAGTIVYDAVPDGTTSDLKPDEAGYTQSTWTGTVWIQNCVYRTVTGTLYTDLSSYGNAGSCIKLTNAKMYFAQGMNCKVPVELTNTDANGVVHDFAVDLTNGFGNGGSVQRLAKITGDGTFKTENAGANEVVSIVDISEFTGKFDLATKIIVIGDADGTVAAEYRSKQAAGTTFPGVGTIVIPAGVTVSVPAAQTWSLFTGFAGAGTLKYTYPWQVGDKSLSNGEYWQGVTELAACVNETTGAIAVYPHRMGGVNSTVVFKGLGPKDNDTESYASYWFATNSINTTIQLDGDVTLYGNGYSGAGNQTTIAKLTGEGNFTLLTELSAITYYQVTLDDYSGKLAAKAGQDCIRVTAILDEMPVAGQKLVNVDATLNNIASLGSVTIDGDVCTLAAECQSGDEGYGLYVTALRRDVYWVGGASGVWSDTTAWALADGTPLNDYPRDYTQGAGDHVIFTNAAEVAIGNDKALVSRITLNADVTFKGDSLDSAKGLYFDIMDGSGKLTLDGVWVAIISEGAGRTFTIYNDVNIIGDCYFNGGALINHIYGNLTGNAKLDYHFKGNESAGLWLHGDNSQFQGQISMVRDSGAYSRIWLDGAQASSANAIWNFECYNGSGTASTQTRYVFTDNEDTYRFGGITGGCYIYYDDVHIEIGGRSDYDSVFKLLTNGSRPYGYVTKVGEGSLTINGYPYHLILKGGTTTLGDSFKFETYNLRTGWVSFMGDGASLIATTDISQYIKDSTSAVAFDSNGNDYTWATALAASNVGGLTKKGSGTLTLSAVPLYSGPTVVEEGTLVVPAGTKLSTLSGNGKLVVDLANAEVTGVILAVGKNEGVTIEVQNSPVDVQHDEKGLIYYVGSFNNYTWNGPTDTESGTDYRWTTLSNWTVNGGTPDVAPTALDTVVFTGEDDAVTIDAAATAYSIQAVGNLTVTANYALDVTTDIAVNGTLVKWGSAAVSVNGGIAAEAVNVEFGSLVATTTDEATKLNLDSQNTSACDVDVVATGNGYGARYAVGTEGTLALSGHGQIVANGGQTVNVAQDETASFTGFMSGAMSLKKTGAGTLAIFGNNTFSGDVSIEAGTLKLNTPLDLGDVRSAFDASREDTVEMSDTTLIWRDVSRPEATDEYLWNNATNAEYVEGDTTIFNGKKVLYSDAFGMVEPNKNTLNVQAKTAFFVMQNLEGQSRKSNGYQNIANDYGNTGWRIGYRNYGYMVYSFDAWYAHGVWANGKLGDVTTTASSGDNGGIDFGRDPAVVTVVPVQDHGWLRGDKNSRARIGGGGKQAWAEYLTYTRELSFDEKAAVEQYLMAKWGIAGEYTALPKTAKVTMAAGATLDMGGLTQTVASFTGAGTVTNGCLKTTGPLTATGALTIQAVAGQTYEIDTTDNLTLTAGENGCFVKIPDGATAVGRLIVPEDWTVGTDETCNVVIVNLPKNWEVRNQSGTRWFTFVIHFR